VAAAPFSFLSLYIDQLPQLCRDIGGAGLDCLRFDHCTRGTGRQNRTLRRESLLQVNLSSSQPAKVSLWRFLVSAIALTFWRYGLCLGSTISG
jgi:hypothetical protein